MINDQQYGRLKRMLTEGKKLNEAALKTGMDEKTARKYRDIGKLPSELKKEHTWKTRKDPFEEVWDDLKSKLELEPGLEALTLFQDLQIKYKGLFDDGQLRTLQRKIKKWRALEGPSKEIMFPQEHYFGRLCQSDFTYMNDLGVTICKEPFPHLVYHLVLTKSNWETGNICFSESFESLSEGFQCAIWKLGGVPECHQTDSLSAAVNKLDNPEEFTQRYTALMQHYGIKPRKINPGKSNENGDVEQSHNRFKKAVDQQLMLRGSRDFSNREEYDNFLKGIFEQRNSGRQKALQMEKKELKPLPHKKLDIFKTIECSVTKFSTISVNKNIYSVNSRLIGEKVRVKLYAENLEVIYAQKIIETMPRILGSAKHRIQYRHIIDSLIRKPGAFENYKYKDDMFPTTRFRIVYDELLKEKSVRNAVKEYLLILNLAAKESETLVDEVLRILLQKKTERIDSQTVINLYNIIKNENVAQKTDIQIKEVNLEDYDLLLKNKEALCVMIN